MKRTMRPLTTQRTGELIHNALTEAGVLHRIGTAAAETGWLATVGHTGPVVYITAHTRRGETSYDVDRAEFIGFNAVVTDEEGTRFVYHGTDGRELRAPQCAAQCAFYVAAFLNGKALPTV